MIIDITEKMADEKVDDILEMISVDVKRSVNKLNVRFLQGLLCWLRWCGMSEFYESLVYFDGVRMNGSRLIFLLQ